eukprot:967044-Prorocentrum_minimum.AAC.1
MAHSGVTHMAHSDVTHMAHSGVPHAELEAARAGAESVLQEKAAAVAEVAQVSDAYLATLRRGTPPAMSPLCPPSDLPLTPL